jgi:hypothetical protein
LNDLALARPAPVAKSEIAVILKVPEGAKP